MATYTPLTTPLTSATNFSQLSPDSQFYINKKMGYDFGNLEKNYGSDAAFTDLNQLLTHKGAAPITSWSQADSALAPLIEKRNAGGIGNFLGKIGKFALPIAAGFLAGPLGGALAGATGLGTTAATALSGAGLGGLSSALTGQNALQGALFGGLSGGLQGATAGKVLAQSGPLKGSLITPGVSSAIASSGPMAGQLVTPSFGSGIGSSISGFNPDLLDKTASYASNLTSKVNGLGNEVSSALGLPTSVASGAGDVFGNVTGLSGSIPTAGKINMNNPLSTALSGYMQYNAQNDIAEKLKKSQQAALQQIQPYTATGAAANSQLAQALAAGFNPGDLSTDTGYQFRLGQGQDALNKSLAARGLGQSGAALKAAQEYGQNFASNEYADAYNRWLANNSQLNNVAGRGYNAASEAGDILGNIGAVGAQGIAGKNNALASTLSSFLSGRGIIGFDGSGNPIYG